MAIGLYQFQIALAFVDTNDVCSYAYIESLVLKFCLTDSFHIRDCSFLMVCGLVFSAVDELAAPVLWKEYGIIYDSMRAPLPLDLYETFRFEFAIKGGRLASCNSVADRRAEQFGSECGLHICKSHSKGNRTDYEALVEGGSSTEFSRGRRI